MRRCWLLLCGILTLGFISFAPRTNTYAVALTASSEPELISALGNAGPDIDITITADFAITGERTIGGGKNVTIHSDGTIRTLTRDANYAGRLFQVNGGHSTLTLANITIDGNKNGYTGSGLVSSLILVGKSGDVDQSSTLNIQSGATLQNNTATNTDSQRGGGAVTARDGSTINMTGGLVTGNTGANADRGGAFYLAVDKGFSDPGAPQLNISGGEISYNSANRGGAVFVQNKSGQVSNINISGDTYIHDNASSGSGGAFFFTGYQYDVNIADDVRINHNTADIDGGALAFNSGLGDRSGAEQYLNISGNVEINDNIAYGNGNTGRGGAIYANTVAVTVTDNVKINDNQSKAGGGIYLSGGDRSNVFPGFVELSGNVQVNGNTAHYDNSGNNNYGGGGVRIAGSDGWQYLAISDNVQINNNTVDWDTTWAGKGGGVYISQCNNMTMTGGQINGNVTSNTSGQTSNPDANGGGIYFHGGAWCNGVGGYTTLTITNGQINNNTSGGKGGGIFVGQTTTNLTISAQNGDKAEINGNSAKDNGGGIELHDGVDWNGANPPTFVLEGNFEINNNIADSDNDGNGDGGGIYLSGRYTALTLSSGQINGNKAVTGGGIQFYGDLTLTGTVQVNGNKAIGLQNNGYSGKGGGLNQPGCNKSNNVNNGNGTYTYYMDSCYLTISGQAEVNGNTADRQGGGIHAGQNRLMVEITDDASVSGNTSNGYLGQVGGDGYGGGGLYLTGFSSGHTSTSGNWTYIYGDSSFTLSGNAKINNNKAETGFGGGIRLGGNISFVFEGNSEVCYNQSLNGGAISEHQGANVILSDDVKICGNTAGNNGGGINLNYDSVSTLEVNNSVQIIDNTAGWDGGGVWVEYPGLIGWDGGGQVSVVDNYLDRISVTSGDVVFFDNTARAGFTMTDAGDIALHGAQIATPHYSWDFLYAYNNYDISYLSNDIGHVARVQFDTAGASSATPNTQYYWRSSQSLAAEPTTPVRAGYRFVGWQGDVTTCDSYDAVNDEGVNCSTSTELWSFSSDIAWDDVTLTALWDEHPESPNPPNTGAEIMSDSETGSLAMLPLLGIAIIAVIWIIKRHGKFLI